MKEEKPKLDGNANPKGQNFQQSILSQQSTFKAPTPGLKDKEFGLVKQLHDTELLKNCESIPMYIFVNYSHGVPKMVMAVKNMDKPIINVHETS